MDDLPLHEAIERFARGDGAVRAVEDSPAAVAFNRWADHLAQAAAASCAALDADGEPVVVLSPDGRVLAANSAARAALALPADGAARLDDLPSEAREALAYCRDRALAGMDPAEGPGIAAHDDHRHLLPLARAARDGQGRTVAAVVTLRSASRARLSDDLKYDLVATVAHELRTPLTSLHMSIHLCLEQSPGPLTDEQGILLSSAREDCERMRLLADELLDMGRLASGRLPLDFERVACDELAQRAWSSFRPQAEEKGIALEFEVPPHLPLVRADRERLHRVFANLLANALRHTPSGGRVALTAELAGDAVRFAVHDSGEGIPADYLDQVFEKFVRGPGKRGQGYGLGLCIARDIVAAHGGEIGVMSELGKGSTFWFTVRVG